MQDTMTRAEAHEIAGRLVAGLRSTFAGFGESLARKSADPNAAEIGAQVQAEIDLLTSRVEADLLQVIMEQPAVGATDGR